LRPSGEPDAQALLHELRVHQLELEMQNEELRTARVDTEIALARYTELFDFAPVAYATINSGHEILNINHAGALLLGSARSTLCGRNFEALVELDHQASFRSLSLAAEESGIKQTAEVELRRERSRPFPVRLSVIALPRAETNLLVAFEDITERRQRQQQLEQTEQALREADRRKDEFLAALSHELRNPLAPIRNSLFVLEHTQPGSDAARRAQHIIERQVTHLTRLIDDLLDVTRIARGKIQLRLEQVELSELIWRTLEDHKSSFEAAGVTLEAQREPKVWVRADSARLVQIVSNLLTNALKFTPRGGRVSVSLKQPPERVLLSIVDTGAGIPEEVLSHIFEPFAQAPQTLDRAKGGLGLGLAMVKGLVELHGGGVTVRSSGLGNGTEVKLWLATCVAPASAAPAATAAQPRPRRVLLIEDNADAAETLQLALSLNGHEVRSALDGPRGLELAALSAPDVVICDIGLPGMDGYAVARALRALPSLSGVFLIALSGYAQPDDLLRAKEAGFDGHLAKPTSLAALEQLLAQATSRTPTQTADVAPVEPL
jgi:two-component system CheB/CheR fusion protein